MDRRGLIPPPPEALQGQPLKFEYVSLLAQAQAAPFPAPESALEDVYVSY